jgi:hypothetical protein
MAVCECNVVVAQTLSYPAQLATVAMVYPKLLIAVKWTLDFPLFPKTRKIPLFPRTRKIGKAAKRLDLTRSLKTKTVGPYPAHKVVDILTLSTVGGLGIVQLPGRASGPESERERESFIRNYP